MFYAQTLSAFQMQGDALRGIEEDTKGVEGSWVVVVFVVLAGRTEAAVR